MFICNQNTTYSFLTELLSLIFSMKCLLPDIQKRSHHFPQETNNLIISQPTTLFLYRFSRSLSAQHPFITISHSSMSTWRLRLNQSKEFRIRFIFYLLILFIYYNITKLYFWYEIACFFPPRCGPSMLNVVPIYVVPTAVYIHAVCFHVGVQYICDWYVLFVNEWLFVYLWGFSKLLIQKKLCFGFIYLCIF